MKRITTTCLTVFLFAAAVFGDVVPPGQITGLGAYQSGMANTIRLYWVTPGDDDYAGALSEGSQYRIQSSTMPDGTGDGKTGWSYNNAQVVISTSGVAPGLRVSATYYLPLPTVYYFKIWTKDETANNWSVSSSIAAAFNSPFSFEMLSESGTFPNQYLSLTIDKNGDLHVAYKGADGYLHYVKRAESVWTSPQLVADVNAYYASIAVNSFGNPYISYTGQDERLQFSEWNGVFWSSATLDAEATVSHYTAIAVDAIDEPHISYFSETGSVVKYAKRISGIWSIETVDVAGNEPTSIAIDAECNPHIAFLGPSSILRYAKRINGVWNVETVDSDSAPGYSVSIALDSESRPSMSYYCMGTGTPVRYAKWTGIGWNIQTIDTSSSGGGSALYVTSLSLDGSGNPHISYNVIISSTIKYAKYNGIAWSTFTIDSGLMGVSMGIGPPGNVHVTYTPHHSGKFKVAHWDTAGLPPPMGGNARGKVQAPTNFRASSVYSSSVAWQWTDNSSNELGFRLYGAATSTGPFVLIAGTSAIVAGQTSFTETGLMPGTSYFRYIVAVNAGGVVTSNGAMCSSPKSSGAGIFSGNFLQPGGAVYDSGTGDYVFAIAVDTITQGGPFVYVTGASGGSFPTGVDVVSNEGITIKYDARGDVAAYVAHGGSGIAIDGAGNVFVTGGVANGQDAGGDCFVIKYDSNLIFKSSATFDGSLHDSGYSIAVDSNRGNVFISAVTFSQQTDWDFLILKYDSNLLFQSSAAFRGAWQDYPAGIAVDKAGNVFVKGVSWNGNNDEHRILKYNSDLVLLSSAAFNSGSYHASVKKEITVDDAGNIYLAGAAWSYVVGYGNYLVLKYDNNLVLRSSAAPDGGLPGHAFDVTTDSAQNIYITGVSEGNYLTVKYNKNLVFQSSVTFSGGSEDWARGIAADHLGNVYVTGWSYNGANPVFRTIRYSMPDSHAVVDPLSPTCKIKVPQDGKKVAGNRVTIMDEITSGAPADVKNILFQYKKSVETVWLNIPAADTIHPNPDTSHPYFIHWDVTSLTEGEYNIRAVLKDKNGNLSASDEISVFVDRVNFDVEENIVGGTVEKKQKISSSEESVVTISGVKNNAYVEVKIPPGAVAAATILKVKSDSSVPLSAKHPEKIQLCEIVFESGQTEILGDSPAEITFSYSDADGDGIVDGTNVKEKDLAVFSYNQSYDCWERNRAVNIDKEKKTCTASVKHFSVYGLFGAVAAGLNDILVYPNPYVPNDGKADTGRPYSASDSETGVIFENLTSDARISIYTVSGECVFDRYIDDTGGRFRWDAVNSAGKDVASGIYFAVIKTPSGGQKITRKIAVVR